MKQVKYFDIYSNGEINRYCVDNTKQFRDMVRIIKHSDKDAVITYIEFDDGTNGFTDDCCGLLNIKKADTNAIDRAQRSNEKALADFRKLSARDKYKECIYYGNLTTFTDTNTTDGWLSFETFEIYGVKFIYVLVAGQVTNCYELQ